MFVIQATHTKKYFVWGKTGSDAWTDSQENATKEKRRKNLDQIANHLRGFGQIACQVISVKE